MKRVILIAIVICLTLAAIATPIVVEKSKEEPSTACFRFPVTDVFAATDLLGVAEIRGIRYMFRPWSRDLHGALERTKDSVIVTHHKNPEFKVFVRYRNSKHEILFSRWKVSEGMVCSSAILESILLGLGATETQIWMVTVIS